MPVTPALGEQRKEDQKFQVTFGDIAIASLVLAWDYIRFHLRKERQNEQKPALRIHSPTPGQGWTF